MQYTITITDLSNIALGNRKNFPSVSTVLAIIMIKFILTCSLISLIREICRILSK